MQTSGEDGSVPQLLVAGGGIGALAAALAAQRAGWTVQVFEQAQEFSEVGAGLQLGPNATRILRAWGLESSLHAMAAFPDAVVARSLGDGRELARLRLGACSLERYGAPYATMHRRDLHHLLLEGVRRHAVQLHLGCSATGFEETGEQVSLLGPEGPLAQGQALIGADGLWSRVRQQLLRDAAAQPTGHLAYRALIPRTDLPSAFRTNEVTAWLGPHQHGVTYPIRGGELLNLVLIVQGQQPHGLQSWDDVALADDVHRALAHGCAALRDLAAAAAAWGCWTLCDRPPIAGPEEMARGRVALLGDAAHPMRPFLAQGAAMALEDAAELGLALGSVKEVHADLPSALGRYAQKRWQRVARVQKRSRRNGRLFHLGGSLQRARDLALGLLGPRLMDVPWLYAYQGAVTADST